jgi:hypothetical protein
MKCIVCGHNYNKVSKKGRNRTGKRDNRNMARHYATHMDCRVPCLKCSLLFPNDDMLVKHMARLHRDVE